MLKKIFTNDTFFLIMTLGAITGESLYALRLVLDNKMLSHAIIVFFSAFCMLLLFFSFISHRKNTMKALLGAILAVEVAEAASCIGETVLSIDPPMSVIYFVLSTALFLNHITINFEHRQSPKLIFLNQLIAIAIVVLIIVWNAVRFFSPANSLGVLTILMDIIGHTCLLICIVCIESRLDAYRLNREKAGWTEEKGYPEGYVHEYEKNR